MKNIYSALLDVSVVICVVLISVNCQESTKRSMKSRDGLLLQNYMENKLLEPISEQDLDGSIFDYNYRTSNGPLDDGYGQIPLKSLALAKRGRTSFADLIETLGRLTGNGPGGNRGRPFRFGHGRR